jgi:Protein of unknown function (DUF3073)
MGRGRQKAKQTKVARELKYFSPNTDYDALAKELHGSSATSTDNRTDGFGDDLDDDEDGSVVDDGDDAPAANGWREAGR